MYDFGLTLKQARINKNLTQRQLANRVELSEATISKYENNIVYPPFDKLRSLSSVLRISLDELCGTQMRETVSVYNLTEEQKNIVNELINTFRTCNEGTCIDFSAMQYAILGKITAELSL